MCFSKLRRCEKYERVSQCFFSGCSMGDQMVKSNNRSILFFHVCWMEVHLAHDEVTV